LRTQRYARRRNGNPESRNARIPRQPRHLPAESDKPLAITRHGDTIGFFLPARRKRTESDWIAFREAADRWQKVLDDAGINEEEVMEDFKRWRAEQREQPA
jgi:hypothetical protein